MLMSLVEQFVSDLPKFVDCCKIMRPQNTCAASVLRFYLVVKLRLATFESNKVREIGLLLFA